jgi:hypothetical protein
VYEEEDNWEEKSDDPDDRDVDEDEAAKERKGDGNAYQNEAKDWNIKLYAGLTVDRFYNKFHREGKKWEERT